MAAPLGVKIVNVETAGELAGEVKSAAKVVDVVIMAAAVSDFTPKNYVSSKIKKSDDASAPIIELIQTEDILKNLVANKSQRQYIVGFAAETGDDKGSALDYGFAKLERKGCDALVVNEVGKNKGFGTDDNAVVILTREPKASVEVPTSSKLVVADQVINVIAKAIH